MCVYYLVYLFFLTCRAYANTSDRAMITRNMTGIRMGNRSNFLFDGMGSGDGDGDGGTIGSVSGILPPASSN